MRDAAKEKRAERDRKRGQGYVLKQIWVKPSWWPKVKRLIDRLT